MTQRYCFADEAGNFDFRPTTTGASRYFILTTVSMESCSVGHALVDLRRELAMEGADVSSPFHASDDKQAVRDRVFETIGRHPFRIDATLLEKAKAQPQLRDNEARFYKMAWYLHLKHLAPRTWAQDDDVLVVAAHLNTKRSRSAFAEAVNDVVLQTVRSRRYRSVFWKSDSDPCLWVADYCSWAIQRKWERGDSRSYDLISNRVTSEFDIWRIGTTRYY